MKDEENKNTFAKANSVRLRSNIKNGEIKKSTSAGNGNSNPSEWKICDLFNVLFCWIYGVQIVSSLTFTNIHCYYADLPSYILSHSF